MKFQEEEITRTEFYRHIRLHQSIKFDKEKKDCFDDDTATQKEMELAKIKCPPLSMFPFKSSGPAR